MLPAYPLVLAVSSSDGAALTASLTATSILHSSGRGPIGANTLQIGSLIKVKIRGRMTTVITTPGTLTFDVRIGSVIVSAFGAQALNVVAQTNATFDLEVIVKVVTVGSGTAATVRATAVFTSRGIIGVGTAATSSSGVVTLPETAPAVGTGFDSSAAALIDVFATWSISNANSIQVHDSVVEIMV